MICTCFDALNVPVFWPILVMYFCILFTITMKRQIKVSYWCAMICYTLSNKTLVFRVCLYHPHTCWILHVITHTLLYIQTVPSLCFLCSIWSNIDIYHFHTGRRNTKAKRTLVKLVHNKLQLANSLVGISIIWLSALRAVYRPRVEVLSQHEVFVMQKSCTLDWLHPNFVPLLLNAVLHPCTAIPHNHIKCKKWKMYIRVIWHSLKTDL